MLPVIMLFLPLITGIVVFPLAGFIFAVLEIFIIVFLKKPINTFERMSTVTGPTKSAEQMTPAEQMKPAEQTKPQGPMEPLPFDKEK